MTRKIEDFGAVLRAAPADRDLSMVEPLVWRRLDDEAGWTFFGRALSPGTSLAATRASLGAIVLMAGVLTGVFAASLISAEFNELAVFSADAPFGPSNILSRS